MKILNGYMLLFYFQVSEARLQELMVSENLLN